MGSSLGQANQQVAEETLSHLLKKICYIFASKCLHLDTFLSRPQAIFEPRNTFPKLWQICFQMASFGHLSVQIWIRPFSKREIVVLVQFYLCQIDFLTTYRYAQMRSRSTPVCPNRRRQLKVLVLSTEINFEAFLEAISESGRRKKYLFYRAKMGRPLVTTPLSVPEISTSALE